MSFFYGVLIVRFLTVTAGTSEGAHLITGHYAGLAVYPLWGLIIGSLFQATRNHELDRRSVKLSYHIYLLHFMIIAAIIDFCHRNNLNERRLPHASVCFSVVAALAFNRLVNLPLEKSDLRSLAAIVRR